MLGLKSLPGMSSIGIGNKQMVIFLISVGVISLLYAGVIIRRGFPLKPQPGQVAYSQSNNTQLVALVNRKEMVTGSTGPKKVETAPEPKRVEPQASSKSRPGPVAATRAAPVPKCIDPKATQFKRVEDVYCKVMPDLLEEYKNPCFYDGQAGGKTTLKCLPYFYILGMDKCATTDLHSRIAAHPDIRGNTGTLHKETGFWSWTRYGNTHWGRTKQRSTLEKYFNYFHLTATEIQNNSNKRQRVITGDATPMDLWDFRGWKLIPQNLGKKQPEVLTPNLVKYIHGNRTPKFLIQLREPVERLYSDYFFLRQGRSPQSFHSHVVRALALIKNCLAKNTQRICFYDMDLYLKLPTRIHLGCYSVYIKEWFSVFPRSAFHFSRTEDFRDDMKTTLGAIFDFLDVDPLRHDKLNDVITGGRKHVTRQKKGRMLPQTFRLLQEFYAPYIKETAAILEDPRYLWRDVYDKRLRSP